MNNMIIDVIAGELRNIKSSVLYLEEVMGQSRKEVIKEILKYLEENE
jgi:hypothetical protein